MTKKILFFLFILFAAYFLAVWSLPYIAKTALTHFLTQKTGLDASVGRVTFKGPSSCAVSDLSLSWKGKERVRLEEVLLVFQPRSLFSKTIEVDNLSLENLSLQITRGRDGSWDFNRFMSRRPKAGGISPREIHIRRLTLHKGELEILDERIQKEPYPIHLVSLEFSVEDLTFPPRDRECPLTLHLLMGGGQVPIFASLNLKGHLNPARSGFDLAVELRDLYLPAWNPYLESNIPMGLEKGKMDLDGELKIEGEKLKGVGYIHVRELALKEGFVPFALQTVFGISKEQFLSFLQDANGELRFPFQISGNLSDPKFELGEMLTNTIRQHLALTLQKGVGKMIQLGSKTLEAGDLDLRAKKVLKELQKTLRLDWLPAEN